MIDFGKADGLKRRVTKYTVEEGDFYIQDKSAAERKEASKDIDDTDGEAIMNKMIECYLCDDKGKLLRLSEEKLSNIPTGLLADIFKAIQGALTGEKKS